MFTGCTASSVKNIIQSFTNPSGNLRLLIATTVFGMGIDSPNTRQIVHWTPPEYVEMYVQQSGRGGRDGEKTVLLYTILKVISPMMLLERWLLTL